MLSKEPRAMLNKFNLSQALWLIPQPILVNDQL